MPPFPIPFYDVTFTQGKNKETRKNPKVSCPGKVLLQVISSKCPSVIDGKSMEQQIFVKTQKKRRPLKAPPANPRT